jgi:hypothetical protein
LVISCKAARTWNGKSSFFSGPITPGLRGYYPSLIFSLARRRLRDKGQSSTRKRNNIATSHPLAALNFIRASGRAEGDVIFQPPPVCAGGMRNGEVLLVGVKLDSPGTREPLHYTRALCYLGLAPPLCVGYGQRQQYLSLSGFWTGALLHKGRDPTCRRPTADLRTKFFGLLWACVNVLIYCATLS